MNGKKDLSDFFILLLKNKTKQNFWHLLEGLLAVSGHTPASSHAPCHVHFPSEVLWDTGNHVCCSCWAVCMRCRLMLAVPMSCGSTNK